MTLFSKMCEEVDGADAELDAAAAATSTSALERRDRAAAALAQLEEASLQVEKMRQKATERDPEKRIYNETMTAKVLALADKLAATRKKAADVGERIRPLAEEEEKAAAEAAAAEARAKVDAGRLAAEREAAAKAALEAEARAAEEAAAAAKREEEQEAARVMAEREAAKAKAKEEAAVAVAAADAARAAEAKVAQEAAEAEKLRKAEEAKAKKAALAARVAAAAPAGSNPVSPPAVGGSLPAATETTHAETSSGPATPSTPVSANAAALAAILASMAPPSAPLAATTPAAAAAALGNPGPKTYGEVRHVLSGASELRGVLEEASAAGALTVVDWSIPTCGPCQRFRPVFERMARERVSTLFVGVDAAASVENRALAQSAAVCAFPTFHFYVGMRRVAELTGADEARIAALVDRHAPASPLSRAALDMQAAISAALMTLRASCGSLGEFIAATRTLLVFVGNVVTHPGEAKYRRVRLANAAFQSKLGRHAGGVAAMEAFGFVKEGAGDDAALVMSERNARHEGLPAMRRLLEQAVPPTG